MKYHIEITLPPIPYAVDISDLAGYLHMVATELTKQETQIIINDYDFTDKMSIFRNMRQPSFIRSNKQTSNVTSNGGTPSATANNPQSAISNAASSSAVSSTKYWVPYKSILDYF